MEKYVFDRKKSKKKFVFSRFKVGSGSVIPRNVSEDLDPYQNETDNNNKV